MKGNTQHPYPPKCHDPYAPFVYKTLVFALVGSATSELMRDYMMDNMALCLYRMPQLPVAVIVEPLIKQWSLYGYMNTDFDFMVALARHLRLGLPHALRLLDLCARVAAPLQVNLLKEIATSPSPDPCSCMCFMCFSKLLQRFGLIVSVQHHASAFENFVLQLEGSCSHGAQIGVG